MKKQYITYIMTFLMVGILNAQDPGSLQRYSIRELQDIGWHLTFDQYGRPAISKIEKYRTRTFPLSQISSFKGVSIPETIRIISQNLSVIPDCSHMERVNELNFSGNKGIVVDQNKLPIAIRSLELNNCGLRKMPDLSGLTVEFIDLAWNPDLIITEESLPLFPKGLEFIKINQSSILVSHNRTCNT